MVDLHMGAYTWFMLKKVKHNFIKSLSLLFKLFIVFGISTNKINSINS